MLEISLYKNEKMLEKFESKGAMYIHEKLIVTNYRGVLIKTSKGITCTDTPALSASWLWRDVNGALMQKYHGKRYIAGIDSTRALFGYFVFH